MTLIEKQNYILDELQKADYFMFNGDKNRAIDFVSENIITIIECRHMATQAVLASSIEKYRDKPADKKLKPTIENILDNAAASIRMLNNICDELNIDTFADIDTHNPNAVSKFVEECTSTLYDIGINNK